MAAPRSNQPPLGNDQWSLFLRQRRLMDQLRRIKNDFKECYCPPGCRGGQENYVPVDDDSHQSLPDQPLHGPYVPADSDMPNTRARPDMRRHRNSAVVAESRGTSDILLHRDRTRATLRMSLQVHTDAAGAGRFGYFAEMFLTQEGQPEEFIGFIQSWYMDRQTRDDWEALYLDPWGARFLWADLMAHRDFFRTLFGYDDTERTRDQNGNLLPFQDFRRDLGAPWARLNNDTDIVYIPIIWMDEHYTGQRIIDQGFELFYRLMTGGSLPEPYNITRPLSVVLEAGQLDAPYGTNWQDPVTGEDMDYDTRVGSISRAYERNGFMRLDPLDDGMRWAPNYYLGRRVDPADHPAAPGDTAIMPPNPPDTDLTTPSPVRARRAGRKTRPRSQTPESPLEGRGRGRGGRGGGRGKPPPGRRKKGGLTLPR